MIRPFAATVAGLQDWERMRAELLAVDFVVGELIAVLADMPAILPRLVQARARLLDVLDQGMEEVRDREFGDHVKGAVATLFSALPD